MSELPSRCICGYQGKIDRLESEVEQYREMAMGALEKLDALTGAIYTEPSEIPDVPDMMEED